MQTAFHYLVYKTTNLKNGKIYIGVHKTKDIDDGYLGSGKMLRAAIEKYGRESFAREVLFLFDNENEMLAKEKELVNEEFYRRPDTYNLCEGGQAGGGFKFVNELGLNGSRLGVEAQRIKRETDPEWREEWSRKQKAGVSVANQCPVKNQKRVATIRERHEVWPGFGKGETHTERTKAIISQKAKQRLEENGNPMSERAWVSNEMGAKLILKSELDEHLNLGFFVGKMGFERSVARSVLIEIRQGTKASKLDELRAEMASLYERYLLGESLRKIALDLPYSYRSLHKRFERCGFELRDKNE